MCGIVGATGRSPLPQAVRRRPITWLGRSSRAELHEGGRLSRWQDWSRTIQAAVTGPVARLVTSGSAHAAVGDQLFKLLASDGAYFDQFGYSVAISGNTAIVGAISDDDHGSGSGSAYLFDVTTGTQFAKLVASDGLAGDVFGWSVAISGNTAIIGAPNDDDHGSNSGSAYLFDVSTGTLLAKLVASDGAADDRFGESVAISGNTAIVGAYWDDDRGGASGSVYLFDVTTGAQLAKLVASDGAAGDEFGRSVAISGNTAIVGAYGDDDHGSNSGSAYLFDVATGTQLAKLIASDGAGGDFFGSSVSISGSTAIVGARRPDGHGSSDNGSAYLFVAAFASAALPPL